MATKTVSLELDAYEKLRAVKRPGESFSEVVRRASFGPSDANGRSILETLSCKTPGPADRAAAAYWERGVEEARTTTPSRWTGNGVR